MSIYAPELSPEGLEYMANQIMLTEIFSELTEEEKMDMMTLITDAIALYVQGCFIEIASKNINTKQ